MKRLKKLVYKAPLPDEYKELFDLLDGYELVQVHRLSENMMYGTNKLKFKDPNFHPKELEGQFGIDYIEVIAEDKNKKEYVCIIKHQWVDEMKQLFSNLNILIEPPLIKEGNQLITSMIADVDTIDQLIEDQVNRYGNDFKILNISTIVPDAKHLSLLLTERQKEIIYYAVENGYFEIPRKINSSDLAEHFGISQSAITEHIRKIEKTIFNSIFK